MQRVSPLPQKLIAQSTDWRFLNELKQELKACVAQIELGSTASPPFQQARALLTVLAHRAPSRLSRATH